MGGEGDALPTVMIFNLARVTDRLAGIGKYN